MNKEDVKQRHPIGEVLARYGIQINAHSFICCPFHKEKTGSCKVYTETNTFHCFGCGKTGDIFDIVELMEGCDFKAAYKMLGGEFEGLTDAAVMRIQRREEHAQAQKRIQAQYNKACDDVIALNGQLKDIAPFSDEWCAAVNKITKASQVRDDLHEQLLKALEAQRNA